MITVHLIVAAGAAAAAFFTADAGRANPIADFYKGRQVTVLVASGAGGLAGLYGRVVGENVVQRIPGKPVPVMQFMPGAGGTRGANYCYNVAPKDGSVICQLSQSVPMAQLLQGTGVRYDAAEFNWLGQSADQNGVLAVWHTSSIKSLDDAKRREVILGATGKASETFIDPRILNAVLGTKFKLILGYRSGADLGLAMEQGEIEGYSGPILSYLSKNQKWLKEGKIRLVSQMGLRKQPKFPNVPLASEYVSDEESSKVLHFIAARARVGRAFVAPPGVPKERVDALRKTFWETMRDPAFLAAAEKRNLEIDPATGEEVGKTVLSILSTPKDIVKRAAAAINEK